jgi:hypothetical protein
MATALTQVIIDWLTSLGWNTAEELGYPLKPGPLILDEPDRVVWITGGGGPGYITEEPALDGGVFQVRLRGPSDDPYEPEIMAGALDTLILRASFPVVIDGVTISHAHRLGNGPTPLPVDPADLRHEFTCNYVFITGV